MIIDNLDVSQLEEKIAIALNGTVSDNSFVGDRPKNVSKMTDFIVSTVNGKMGGVRTEFQPVSGNCLVLIEIWVKDKNGGLKNSRKITEIRKKLTKLLPYKGEFFTLTYNSEIGSRDSLDFHSVMINLNCNIF